MSEDAKTPRLVQIVLSGDSGPYANYHEAGDAKWPDPVVDVPEDLWKWYKDVERLFRRLEDQIGAFTPKPKRQPGEDPEEVGYRAGYAAARNDVLVELGSAALRDRFAMAALTGILASPLMQATDSAEVAGYAYHLSDAMIEARKLKS